MTHVSIAHHIAFGFVNIRRSGRLLCLRMMRTIATSMLSNVKVVGDGGPGSLAIEVADEWQLIFDRLPSYRQKLFFAFTRILDALMLKWMYRGRSTE